jgi:type IV pilus assembly protein PilA
MKHNEGFSLIELLIVVAIILIIAAIAIPNLLKSKMAANQASAVASLRTINTSEVTYSSTYNQGYTSTLVQLGPAASGSATSSNAGLVDSVLAGGNKSGYTFTYTAGAAVNGSTPTYQVNANPVARNRRQLRIRRSAGRGGLRWRVVWCCSGWQTVSAG